MSRISCFAAALLYSASVELVTLQLRADEPSVENVEVLDSRQVADPFGDDSDNSRASRHITREQQIREELFTPSRLEFVDTELHTVLLYLSDLHHLQIVVDEEALDDCGVSSDTLISVDVKNISLRAALKIMLDPLDLVYCVRNEVLLITTADEQPFVVKSYLIGAGKPTEWVDAFHLVEPSSWDEVGGGGRAQAFGNVMLVRQTEYVHEQLMELSTALHSAVVAENPVAAAQSSPSVVIESAAAGDKHEDAALELRIYPDVPGDVAMAIVSVIHPESWHSTITDGPRGPGNLAMLPGRLLVYQTPTVHSEISGLLKELKDSPSMTAARNTSGGLGGGGGGFGGGGGQF